MQKGWKISSEDWWDLDYEAVRARKEGSIISQLQNAGEQQILQNRKVIKKL